MKPSRWPFRPDHITNDGESQRPPDQRPLAGFGVGPAGNGAAKCLDLRLLDGVGIISNEYLRGIQTSICANLANPTTIIEFSPRGEPVRTDSRLLVHALRPACSMFRNYTRCKWCYQCDNVHAGLFRGLARPDLWEQIQKRIARSTYIQRYLTDPEMSCKPRDAGSRVYLEYDCPLLGYQEIIFPIFFEDSVIAVFFVGEIVRKGKLLLIPRRQESFFASHPNCCGDGREWKHVLAGHAEWIEKPSHVLDDDDAYPDLIDMANAELAGMEKTLGDQMQLQRDQHVRARIDRTILRFRARLSRPQRSKGDPLDRLWNNMRDRMKELVSDFAIRYAVVFGIERLTREPPDTLGIVAHTQGLPPQIVRRVRSIRFRLAGMSEKVLSKATTSVEHPELLKAITGLKGQLPPRCNLVRIFPVPLFARSSAVVLIGYRDDNPLTSPENAPQGYLDRSLESFYTVGLSALSSVLAATAQQQMETAFRVFGHEAGQLTSGLDWLRQVYLSSPSKVRKLSEDKAEDLVRDIEGYMRQLSFLFEQANILVSETPRPRKRRFLAFRELLFKWKDTYRLETEAKRLQFVVAPLSPSDPERPKVYGDPILLEQLLYNLVSNAVKYCYRGTKIHLDCRKAGKERGSPHVLTVTNYGIQIEPGRRVYELYHRGENVKGQEGLGIGLSVGMRIAESHDGTVEHECDKVSEFNVPLIEPYLQRDFPGKDQAIIPRLNEELSVLKAGGAYSCVVALHDRYGIRYYHPSDDELVKSIATPTCRVTFRVIIPSREAAQ